MAENMRDILDTVAKGEDLNIDQAAFAFREMFEGELTPAQSGALLMGLRAKGETPMELAAAARAGLARARQVSNLPAGYHRGYRRHRRRPHAQLQLFHSGFVVPCRSGPYGD